MTEPHIRTEEITALVKDHLSAGLTADYDTVNFIKSCYGISGADEISSFIEKGDESGVLIEMLSYPPDSFRERIEHLVPGSGLPAEEIRSISRGLTDETERINVLFLDRIIPLTAEDSNSCRLRFLHRLNLDFPFEHAAELRASADKIYASILLARLRRRRFTSSDDNIRFMTDLASNFTPGREDAETEFRNLVDVSADLLNRSDKRVLDILSEKKYFYENAISESQEFALLLKTYSMEFIMMKRIQPPLISIDEARLMIRTIDRLTGTVYGMIIPSVQNILLDF